MRPILKPGLGRVWLDPNTLQLGRGPHRRIHQLDSAERVLLEALDGTRDIDGLLSYGARLGLTSERSLGLLNRLALEGSLDDAALPTPGLARLSVGERARLGPVVSALGLRNGLPGAGARALERRAQQHTAVYGLGPIGAQVARQLAAAGVGVVRPVDPNPADHRDTGPGALDPAHVGKRRQEAACRAIQRDTPSTRIAPAYSTRRPDLVVVAPVERYPVEFLGNLMADGVPHLLVRPAEDEVLVGPLVLPGRTACVHCADLRLSELDPSWPQFLAQFGAARPGELPPADTSLMLLGAAYAVQYALTHLDGREPTVLGALTSLRPPDATPLRIEIDAHPSCGCGARSFLHQVELLE
ncbi:TOMM precursor leader peptide-binding protein [Actinospica sp.]|uniref:TOMM precursor leader peptide-binding protein n=1 Tax=Actinospica sp. TaxID=1872142 RepID=UPI002C9E4E84|nr:TOMM precursor leader peptide-binding protein [Actinospica sp.]HWG24712.1 TOMM precursor leader peptide-binding protein [Actinospica sp.]